MQQVPYYDEELYRRHRNGSLQREIDEATKAHGYGTLSTGESIGASGPRYTCASVANKKQLCEPFAISVNSGGSTPCCIDADVGFKNSDISLCMFHDLSCDLYLR